MPNQDRPHDFFHVIDDFYQQQGDMEPELPTIQTHPLEDTPPGASKRPKDAFDKESYDYKLRVQQFDLNEPAAIEEYERIVQLCLDGECILRDEKSSTDRDGNFRALVSWIEIKKKKPTKH